MRRHITIDNRKYLIRGDWTAKELRQQYKSFRQKYPNEISILRWATERGKIYFETGERK